MQIIFIYFSVFICVLIFSDFGIRYLRDLGETKRHVNYRISLIDENTDRKVVYERMLRERGLDYDSVKSRISWVKLMIGQSGMRFEGFRSILYIGAIALVGFLVLIYLDVNPIISLLLGFVFAFFVVVVLIAQIRSRRINKFVVQLPDALDVAVRSLSAGHPLTTSISLVGREMADPVGSEFGIMSDEMTYGVDIDAATRNMSKRVGADELNLLAISLSIQHGSGGNLSEILTNLSDMMRKRTMMKAKIKSLSAEGRMTSWIMLIFPFFLYGMISLISPSYFSEMWASDQADTILIVAISLMTLGMLILRKIVNFDF